MLESLFMNKKRVRQIIFYTVLILLMGFQSMTNQLKTYNAAVESRWKDLETQLKNYIGVTERLYDIYPLTPAQARIHNQLLLASDNAKAPSIIANHIKMTKEVKRNIEAERSKQDQFLAETFLPTIESRLHLLDITIADYNSNVAFLNKTIRKFPFTLLKKDQSVLPQLIEEAHNG